VSDFGRGRHAAVPLDASRSGQNCWIRTDIKIGERRGIIFSLRLSRSSLAGHELRVAS